jgi:hypothetical protein
MTPTPAFGVPWETLFRSGAFGSMSASIIRGGRRLRPRLHDGPVHANLGRQAGLFTEGKTTTDDGDTPETTSLETDTRGSCDASLFYCRSLC